MWPQKNSKNWFKQSCGKYGRKFPIRGSHSENRNAMRRVRTWNRSHLNSLILGKDQVHFRQTSDMKNLIKYNYRTGHMVCRCCWLSNATL